MTIVTTLAWKNMSIFIRGGAYAMYIVTLYQLEESREGGCKFIASGYDTSIHAGSVE